LIVADLPASELRRRLHTAGLRIRVGPIVAEIRSRFRVVESAIALHYAAHAAADAGDFADFHVSVDRPHGHRRFIRPQALFRFEGNPPFRPLPATQAFPLLEWGLNWCVSTHCHQYLVLHAAVVERGGRALILPAPPGSGKSTLCAALVSRGWRLLSDELTLLDVAALRIVPLPRPISLKNESIAAIARFSPGAAMSPTVRDTEKGSVGHLQPPADSVRLARQSATPGWVVLPRYRSGEPTALAALPKPVAFMQLVDSAFNYSIHGRAGFVVLADRVAASRCFRFTYGGALDEAVRVFDDLSSDSCGE
jgi:HprK-related kinase A